MCTLTLRWVDSTHLETCNCCARCISSRFRNQNLHVGISLETNNNSSCLHHSRIWEVLGGEFNLETNTCSGAFCMKICFLSPIKIPAMQVMQCKGKKRVSLTLQNTFSSGVFFWMSGAGKNFHVHGQHKNAHCASMNPEWEARVFVARVTQPKILASREKRCNSETSIFRANFASEAKADDFTLFYGFFFTTSSHTKAPADTVVVHGGWGRGYNAPSLSPFVLKMETYLRVAEIPHEVLVLSSHTRAFFLQKDAQGNFFLRATNCAKHQTQNLPDWERLNSEVVTGNLILWASFSCACMRDCSNVWRARLTDA